MWETRWNWVSVWSFVVQVPDGAGIVVLGLALIIFIRVRGALYVDKWSVQRFSGLIPS